MSIELISFKLCPFVQRSVITLEEKGAPYEITYIDLAAPPDWFLAISPFGKVPVLKVDDTVIFESAVINEYVDEVNPPTMHPADPLRKAHNRSWIEFGSNLIMEQYSLSVAEDEETFDKYHHKVVQSLKRLETVLEDGPYFNGENYSLLDAAYAPTFLRFALLEEWYPLGIYEGLPKVTAWQQALLERPSTRASVVEDFDALLKAYIRDTGGYAAQCYGA